MKTCLLKFVSASTLIFGGLQVSAQTEDTSTTESKEVISTPAPAAAPSWIYSVSYYKYDLQGSNSANTRIYGFDASTVDLYLATATWLYSPQWTFIAFVPYIKNMVETIYEPTPAGLNFKTRDYTEGLGDIRLMGLSPLWASGRNLLMYDVSVTLPTGSTDEYFTSAPTQRAAYNMQPGTGTPDLILGGTYYYTVDKWVSSARAQATVRGGKNAHGYAFGNEFQANLTSKYQLTSYFNLGAQFNYKVRDAIQGRDGKYELNNNYVSPVDPAIAGDGHQYYHAPQINWDASVVAKLQSPTWSGYSVSLEAALPFYQEAINKDDIRLDINNWFAVTVNAAF
ncbi:MAG: transporter [Bdellovibrio sp.]